MTSLQKLIEVLNEIYQMQTEMVALAVNKKQVLIDGDIEELSNIMQRESSWINKLKQLDIEREKQIKIVVLENRINSSDLKISDILTQLSSSDEKDKLAVISDKLMKVLDEVKQVNEINSQLIRQSLQYISHTFQSLTHESNQNMTYSKPTNKQNNNTSIGIYDQKA